MAPRARADGPTPGEEAEVKRWLRSQVLDPALVSPVRLLWAYYQRSGGTCGRGTFYAVVTERCPGLRFRDGPLPYVAGVAPRLP